MLQHRIGSQRLAQGGLSTGSRLDAWEHPSGRAAWPAGVTVLIRKQKQFRSTMKDLLTTLSSCSFLCPFYNGQPIRPAGPQSAGTLTVVPFWRRLSRRGRPGSARPSASRVEERVDLAREGGGRCPVADDVGEQGPPAAAPDAPELPGCCQPSSGHK